MRADLVPGGQFPDLALPDQGQVLRSLSELASGDPLVVHFYRGWFCPKKRAWLPDLLALVERAEVGDMSLSALRGGGG